MVRDRNSRRLIEVAGFGSNPGSLKCWMYLPTILAPNTPLVVALHGCTQTADGYDYGTGWSQLAEEKGFAVLLPEQQRSNNANLCFNWFEPGDTRRDSGEALSIREMIDHVVLSHGMDRRKVFITGLSAGGAMANVLLSTYPELFAGGAIIGGLAFGVSAGVGQAFERMQGRNAPTEAMLQSAVAVASPHRGPWPTISVWQGTHDQTVKPINAEQIVGQWRGVHGAKPAPIVSEINGNIHKIWIDKAGEHAIELYLVKGMAHGVPLSAQAERPLGRAGPFMLDVGIASTVRIARRWNLANDGDVAVAERVTQSSAMPRSAEGGLDAVIAKAMAKVTPDTRNRNADAATNSESGVTKVINDALRAAGLMR